MHHDYHGGKVLKVETPSKNKLKTKANKCVMTEGFNRAMFIYFEKWQSKNCQLTSLHRVWS